MGDIYTSYFSPGDVRLLESSTTWKDSNVQTRNIYLSGNAALHIQNASFDKLFMNDNSVAFLKAAHCGGDMKVSGASMTVFGSEFYDQVLPNKGFVIYHEASGMANSNIERACLQCRLADEVCLRSFGFTLSDSFCIRCYKLNLFCAESEAWSVTRGAAKLWMEAHPNFSPNVATVSLPFNRPVRATLESTPSQIEVRGLQLAGTGHGFRYEKVSNSNWFKLMVERWINSRLLWWPLRDPLRYGDPTNTEIWRCVSLAMTFIHRLMHSGVWHADSQDAI